MTKKKKIQINRITVLKTLSFLTTAVILGQLMILQIINYDRYYALAQKEHSGYTELPARRGEILTKDYHSEEIFKLATNITLDTLYSDPVLIENKTLVAETLAPLIFDLEEEKKLDQKRVENEWMLAKTEEERNKIQPMNETELLANFKKRLEEQFRQETREEIILETNLSKEMINVLEALALPGIKIKKSYLYAYPKEITNKQTTISQLSPLLNIEEKELLRIFEGKNRYLVLKRKLEPEISEKIQELLKNDISGIYRGIGLQEKYYRYYPENELAAQVIGFIDQNGNGQYGIEGSFNTQLKGKEGIFASQKDASGQQITVGESTLRPAIDGDDIVLTIDRSIQLEVEKRVKEAMSKYQAEAIQVVIMDPKTGKMIAMVNYPTFNPNEFSKSFEKTEIALSSGEIENLIPIDKESKDPKHFWFYTNFDTKQRIEIFKEKEENGAVVYKKYKNRVGSRVYRNAAISDAYEPGSVFKVITMASALDAGEVKPGTTNYESGPIKVDEYEIHNANDIYRGRLTMTQVLEYSSNIGISFVGKKLGRNLFYNYMKNFGFGERTDFELEAEHPGQIEFFTQWAESELLTHAFGQGILATPLQMVTAISAIANGGLLMQPYIIDSIIEESGKTYPSEPKIIRRVITEETANTLSSMMVSSVENGVAARAKTKNHYIAGKTGTAQTYKHGKALTGAGTTIGSFAGFGPIDDPKFVVLIKVDFALVSPWGSATAAPLFAEIAEYLLNYYNIPPDK